MKKIIVVVGGGGHGRVVADVALCTKKWNDILFYDDMLEESTKWHGYAVAGDMAMLEKFLKSADKTKDFIVGIGNNAIRLHLSKKMENAGGTINTLIHPSASVSRFSNLGKGSVVLPGAVINTDVETGACLILNTNATIEHDCRIGHGVHMSPNSALAGGVSVGDRVWIGIGACVRENISIGTDAVIGAGATVINDVPSNTIVGGTPAKPISTKGNRS